MMQNIQAHLCRKYDKKDVLTVDKYHFGMTQPSNQDKFQLIKTVYLTN